MEIEEYFGIVNMPNDTMVAFAVTFLEKAARK